MDDLLFDSQKGKMKIKALKFQLDSTVINRSDFKHAIYFKHKFSWTDVSVHSCGYRLTDHSFYKISITPTKHISSSSLVRQTKKYLISPQDIINNATVEGISKLLWFAWWMLKNVI